MDVKESWPDRKSLYLRHGSQGHMHLWSIVLAKMFQIFSPVLHLQIVIVVWRGTVLQEFSLILPFSHGRSLTGTDLFEYIRPGPVCQAIPHFPG